MSFLLRRTVSSRHAFLKTNTRSLSSISKTQFWLENMRLGGTYYTPTVRSASAPMSCLRFMNTEIVRESEENKPTDLATVLGEEIQELRTVTLQESNWEEATQFLSESGFKVKEGKGNIVELIKNDEDYRIKVVFSCLPDESMQDQLQDEEGEEQEGNEEEEQQSGASQEEGEEAGGEEGENEGNDYTHEFHVEITRKGKKNSVRLQCLATETQLVVVNILNTIDPEALAVQVDQDLSPDLQDSLYTWLEKIGIDERVANFIIEYVNQSYNRQKMQILEDMHDFLN